MPRNSLVLTLGYLGFLTVLSGCGAMQQASTGAKRSQLMNNLKQLGLAYHNCHDQNARGPLNWQEAQQNGLAAEVQAELVAEGFVVHWGVKFKDAMGGTSNFVLAYPPKAASEGGSILLLDGSVHQMSAQEFNAALAQQKIDSPKAMAGAASGGGDAPPANASAPSTSPGY